MFTFGAPRTARASGAARVAFQVKAPLGFGQTLLVSGSSPSLGNGDAKSAVELVTDPDSYPLWYSKTHLTFTSGKEVHYEYLVFQRGKFLRKEDRMRSFTPEASGSEMVIEDEFNVFAARSNSATHEAGITRLHGEGTDVTSGQTLNGSPVKTLEQKQSSENERSSSDGGVQFSSPLPFGHKDGGAANDTVDAVLLSGDFQGSRADRPIPPTAAHTSSISPISSVPVQPHKSLARSTHVGHSSRNRKGAGAYGKKKTSRSRLRKPGKPVKMVKSSSTNSLRSEDDHVRLELSDSVICVLQFLPVLITYKPPKNSSAVKHGDTEQNSNLPSNILQTVEQGGGDGDDFSPLSMEDHSTGGRWEVKWDSDSLFSRKKKWAADEMRVLWIGTLRQHVPLKHQETVERILAKFRCIPLFLPRKLAQSHYSYCKQTLWPVFHNYVDVYASKPTRWWDRSSQNELWQAYTTVNQMFTTKIVEEYNPGDLVWIQDYHLLLVSSFLSRRIKDCTIGLFLHIPFPSSEIFRTLSIRDDILRSMLQSDHLGFHCYEYARHFLTCCRRLQGLSYEARPGGVINLDYQGRSVRVTVTYAGIEPRLVLKRLKSRSVLFRASRWRQIAAGRSIVCGVDRLERLAGIQLKLMAYERLLLEHPEWRKQLLFVQLSLRDEFRGDDYRGTRHEVRQLVKRINAMAPGSLIYGEFFSRDSLMKQAESSLVSTGQTAKSKSHAEEEEEDSDEWFGIGGPYQLLMAERIALFKASDVFVNSCVRQSMNPFHHEFIVTGQTEDDKEDRNGSGDRGSKRGNHTSASETDEESLTDLDRELISFSSVRELEAAINSGNDAKGEICNDEAQEVWSKLVVASEFSANCRIFNGCIQVNPWRSGDLVGGIIQALNMPANERRARWGNDILRVLGTPTSSWVLRVAQDLKRARKKESEFKYEGLGLGLGFKTQGFKSNFTKLPMDKVIQAYRSSFSRVILLDAGGTLFRDRDVDDNTDEALSAASTRLSERVSKALANLSSDTARNTVFILSSRQRGELEHLFQNPNVGIAAEHGYMYVWASDRSANMKMLENNARSAKGGKNIAKQKSTENSTRGIPVSSDGKSSEKNKDGDKYPATDYGWQMVGEHLDNSWMEVCHSIMQTYCNRTSGTFVEKTRVAIIWQYEDADPEYGQMQAAEIVDHLQNSLRNFPVEVVPGNNYVEVRPRDVNKGRMVATILDELEEGSAGKTKRNAQPLGSRVDFILCIGDDLSDEYMFKELLEREREKQASGGHESKAKGRQGASIYTACVGRKPTQAKHYVNGVDEVIELLELLGRSSAMPTHSKSMIDLRTWNVNKNTLQLGGIGNDKLRSIDKTNANANTSTNLHVKKSPVPTLARGLAAVAPVVPLHGVVDPSQLQAHAQMVRDTAAAAQAAAEAATNAANLYAKMQKQYMAQQQVHVPSGMFMSQRKRPPIAFQKNIGAKSVGNIADLLKKGGDAQFGQGMGLGFDRDSTLGQDGRNQLMDPMKLHQVWAGKGNAGSSAGDDEGPSTFEEYCQNFEEDDEEGIFF